MVAKSFGTTKTIMAGFVGDNSGTIASCIIETCSFMSYREANYCSVAPIVGKNSGTVKNCIVDGYYSIDSDKNKGIRSHYFAVTGNEATNSIYAAYDYKATEGDKYEIYTPSENGDTALNSGKGNYNSAEEAAKSFSSDIMSTSIRSTLPWYKYPNNYTYYGWKIYLKVFITLETFSFDTNGDGNYETTIYVPSHQWDAEYDNIQNQLTSATIKFIFDSTTVTASSKTGYSFSGWGSDDYGILSYKAIYIVGTCTIKFNTVDYTNITEAQSHLVDIGTIVNITLTPYAGNASKYSKILFSFTDSNGDYVEVEYQVDNQHYLTWSGETTKTINTNFEFTVGVQLKTYGTQFG